MVVLPLQVLYGVKPGKESTLVTGKSSDPAWVTFRDGRYLTVGDQQVSFERGLELITLEIVNLGDGSSTQIEVPVVAVE